MNGMDETSVPKITVITNCYNQGETLAQAIESVFAQTLQPFEYLLIDDGSTDNTLDIMRYYAALYPRIKLLALQPNVGVAESLNRSIANTQGDIWVWAPADDTFKPTLLETKMKESTKHNHEAVLYSGFEYMDRDGKYTSTYIPKKVSPENFFQASYDQCFIGFTGIWIPKSVFDKVGVFQKTLKDGSPAIEDYYWMLTASKAGIPFYGMPDVLFSKRVHANGISARIRPSVPSIVKRTKEELSR